MILRAVRLPQKNSFFLFGRRQTGKSTLINHWLKPLALVIDLLNTDQFLRFTRDPSQFLREAEDRLQRASGRTIFIDEV